MRLRSTRLYAAAIALCLFGVGNARADLISWSYNWTPTATEIVSDNDASSKILLSNEPGSSTVGDSFIVATNIRTVSDVKPGEVATFNAKPYSLVLTIFDDASKKNESLTFSGKFSGTLNSKSAIIMNEFTSPEVQSVQIGNHLYTIKIGPFAPPGPPTATNSGSISALASVTVQEVPEPSTLALAGLCLGVCGTGWYLRRQQRARSLALDLA